jgi:hypothetical protein
VHEILFFFASFTFGFLFFPFACCKFLLNPQKKTRKQNKKTIESAVCGESCVYTKPLKPDLKILKQNKQKTTEAGLISLTRLVQNGGGRSNSNKGLNGIREEQHENQPPEPQQQQQQAHVPGRHAWALPFTNLAIGLTLPTCA